MQCRFFRVFIVRISLLERDLKRVTKWIASESVHLNRKSSKSERNQSGRTVKRSVKLRAEFCTVFILLSSVFSFFSFFFFFWAVLMLLIKISVVCACNEGARVSCPLFLCFKENITTCMLSNFPFGMYLPFLAWPTLSRVTVARWIGSMFFFKLKLAKPQKFAEFTLFWFCTSAKSHFPLSDSAQVYFHLRSDAIFSSN